MEQQNYDNCSNLIQFFVRNILLKNTIRCVFQSVLLLVGISSSMVAKGNRLLSNSDNFGFFT